MHVYIAASLFVPLSVAVVCSTSLRTRLLALEKSSYVDGFVLAAPKSGWVISGCLPYSGNFSLVQIFV